MIKLKSSSFLTHLCPLASKSCLYLIHSDSIFELKVSKPHKKVKTGGGLGEGMFAKYF